MPAYSDIATRVEDLRTTHPLPKGWKRTVMVRPQVRQAIRVAQLAGTAPEWAQDRINGVDLIDCADPEVLGWVVRDVAPGGRVYEPGGVPIPTSA